MPPPLPVPPTTAARPRRRGREVSSRYLSTPVPSTPRLSTASAASSTRSRSPTPSPRGRQRAATPFANENHPPPPPPPTGTVARRRAVQKLFDETGAGNPRASLGSNSSASAVPAPTPRPLPRSTSRPAAHTERRGYPRLPTPAHAGSSCPSSAAVESDAASCCSSSDTSSTATDFSEADVALGMAPAAPCESPPLRGPASCRGGRLSSELRSSVPESGGSSRASNPLCYRSLNSALSISMAMAGKLTAAGRPPQPQGPKAADLKKATIVGGRKVAGKQEDVHQLRLMDNSYLQYRFLNAWAEAAGKAKAAAAEKSLYGLEEKIASLRASVAEKRAGVERMQRDHRLSSVVNAQVPYLKQWSDIEGGHASCLIGATTALYNASLRLPIIGSVNANCEELTEVLKSATQLLEPLSPCIENFLPKVQQIDDVACNLAQVIATERTLIEECGNLLYQAQNLQMRESSLRSQVMQLKENEAK
ncbi:protein ENDOSPERM DEFECTIVE 1-like [Miscanthus floridulus]|uniref:protein ENDOSPERM DEFECTIVE 1-like n=1 Tax=Miscanthus floridulus TaxID=154761 RepID=UPI0034580C8E